MCVIFSSFQKGHLSQKTTKSYIPCGSWREKYETSETVCTAVRLDHYSETRKERRAKKMEFGDTHSVSSAN